MRPAAQRKQKYEKKIRGLVLPGQTDRYAPTAAERIHLEYCVKREAITPMLQFSYVAFAEELLKHQAAKRPEERDGIYNKWLNRGLDSTTLISIAECVGVTIPPPPPPPACIDLTDPAWIEVDPATVLTVTADNVNFTAMPQVLNTYVYKDYGVDHFTGDFEHWIDFRHSFPDEQRVTNFWVLANVINNYDAFDPGHHIQIHTWPPNKTITLRQRSAGGVTQDISIALTENQWYYLAIKRVGNVATCEIYSSAALRIAGGAGDVDTLTVTQTPAGSYRYLYVMNGGVGTAGTGVGDVHCLIIQS